ncbi:MAG: Exodeoxyribonuclease 7 small subunit [Akkermansiaceae bacterium]|nr:Exodeoxyribonuclease 7 small subunit [Akkermansiaceae bacterium]
MSRKKTTSDPGAPVVPFETALAELESIVAAMEEDQLPLEDLVANYEKGSKLLSHCETVLTSARKRLQTISERQAAGNAAEAPDSLDDGDEMADDAPATPDAPDDDDDDIRLF